MQKFTATLPAVRCTAEMRVAVEALAAGIDMADVIREAVHLYLVSFATEEDAEEVEAWGHEEPVAVVNDRTAGCAWGPPTAG